MRALWENRNSYKEIALQVETAGEERNGAVDVEAEEVKQAVVAFPYFLYALPP